MSDYNMKLLVGALLQGDQELAVSETKKLMNDGVSVDRIIADGVEFSMVQLDDKCTVEQFNLLEIMLVGRASMAVMKEIYPPGSNPPFTKGTVVIGSLEGDIHDLGKGIVKMVLTAKGYKVVDCGKDCPVEKMINTARKEKAHTIAISGLITTVIPSVKKIKDRLKVLGMSDIMVIAGGAALKQASVSELNVDFVGDTAFDAGHYLDQYEWLK